MLRNQWFSYTNAVVNTDSLQFPGHCSVRYGTETMCIEFAVNCGTQGVLFLFTNLLRRRRFGSWETVSKLQLCLVDKQNELRLQWLNIRNVSPSEKPDTSTVFTILAPTKRHKPNCDRCFALPITFHCIDDYSRAEFLNSYLAQVIT